MASRHRKIGIRYSRALLRALIDTGVNSEQEFFAVLETLESLNSACVANREFWDLINNPVTPMFKKKKVVDDVISKTSESSVLRKFILTTLENNRFQALPEIAECFHRLVYDHLKIIPVKVTSSRDLGEEERRNIETVLKSKFSGSPEFLWRVDPSIIGGLVVEYEGHRIDASLTGKLGKIRQELGV